MVELYFSFSTFQGSILLCWLNSKAGLSLTELFGSELVTQRQPTALFYASDSQSRVKTVSS